MELASWCFNNWNGIREFLAYFTDETLMFQDRNYRSCSRFVRKSVPSTGTRSFYAAVSGREKPQPCFMPCLLTLICFELNIVLTAVCFERSSDFATLTPNWIRLRWRMTILVSARQWSKSNKNPDAENYPNHNVGEYSIRSYMSIWWDHFPKK